MTILRTNGRDNGRSPRALQRDAAAGRLRRVSGGIYVEHETDDPEAQWRDLLRAHLERGGPKSALSHRTAARLHGLEGFADGPRTFDITVPLDAGWRTAPAIRSGTLLPADVTSIDGLRVTTIGRTLVDLGRFASADQLELAVEHALRGPDRRRPDVWAVGRLAELERRARESRTSGGTVLRIVLLRRGGARPTGSFAETVFAQAARASGLVLDRQVEVIVVNRRGRIIGRYFADFGLLWIGLLIEIDGAIGHGSDDQIDRDDRRQNQLLTGFDMYRVHARRLFADPDAVAAEVKARCDAAPRRESSWTTPSGGRVTITDARAELRI